MANLSILNIRERLFNNSKHETNAARVSNGVSNPFSASSFKGNVLTADVFESSTPKAPAFTGAVKLTASTLVGSLSNFGSKIQSGIEAIAAFGRRMKGGISNTWQKMQETEISFSPLADALSNTKSNMITKWHSMFEKGITVKRVADMPISEIRPLLSNEVALAEDAAKLIA